MKEEIKRFNDLKPRRYLNLEERLELKELKQTLKERRKELKAKIRDSLVNGGKKLTSEEEEDLKDIEAALKEEPETEIAKPGAKSRSGIRAWVKSVWSRIWAWVRWLFPPIFPAKPETQPVLAEGWEDSAEPFRAGGGGKPPGPETEERKEKPEKSCLIPWAVAVCCAILAIILALGVFYNEKAKRTEAIKEAVTAVEKERDAAISRAQKAEADLKKCQEAVAKAEAKMKLATIDKKGIEGAFIRQLRADPSLLKGVKVKVGDSVYDLTDKNAGAAADLIARNLGYVSIDGREVWIREPGIVAYLIVREGDKLVMREIERGPDGKFKDEPTETKQSSSMKTLMFEGEGDQAGALQRYERVHTPQRPALAQSATLPALFTIGELLP